ncbi:MAG: RNA polymerase sigma factor [Rhodospirillales bacterium]|nr:RNA polymerase sigma factor [Rhodospirillales bacterium]
MQRVNRDAMTDAAILIEPLIPALRRYAMALLHHRATADDLVQDALERAISRWHQRRSDLDTRAWLFTILHHLAVNRMRQAARRGAHSAIEDVAQVLLAEAPRQEEAMAEADILHAVQALPEEFRAVLLLVSVEGLSYAETARVLGVPLGTIMSRLSRARERLSRKMEAGHRAPAIALRRVK